MEVGVQISRYRKLLIDSSTLESIKETLDNDSLTDTDKLEMIINAINAGNEVHHDYLKRIDN